ncbi:cytochrome ubiquinol oxidase subunit I [Candidatus Saccharibacteria bacterium]|nr:cytochrome ubiquinol oxidase subunit I [Candidatus Saccharibacteria bacterium]
MPNEGLDAARVLMGDSLGFHIIFVMFGLTLPILVSWFEWMGIRRKNPELIRVAKFWSKIMAMLVITGVVSGTIIALQMSLVWPGILKFGGEVIGLPFMFETYAFFIEATFLALYMTTWNNKRITPKMHNFFGWMTAFGATLSAYAITSVNGWMNLPTGFDIINGKFANVDVFKAMFSNVALIEFFHSMPGYYLSASLFIAGFYGIRLMRAKTKDRMGASHKTDRFIFKTLVLFGIVMFIFSGITADLTGKYLAKNEPEKLAALELMYETADHAPLLIGGVAGENGEILGPHFKIPNALSILAGGSTTTIVKGLREYDDSQLPPLYVHTLFDIKMTLITAYVAIFGLFLFTIKWFKKWHYSRPMIGIVSLTGIMGIIIVELGWMMTEIGRQPWAVRNHLTTAEALTKTHNVSTFGYLFPLAYVGLFIVTVLALRKIMKSETKTLKGGK